MTNRPGYLFLGMVAAVLPDVDALLPGFDHHGWLHTPVFVCFVSLTLWGTNNQDRLTLRVMTVVMASHLFLDSIGGGIAWLWPVSTTSISPVPVQSTAGLTAVRVFLMVAPAYWIWNRWKHTGEGPIVAVRWAEKFLPRPVAWSGVSSFCLATTLVLASRLLAVAPG